MPQRLDGIEPRGAASREIAENYANGRREQERQQIAGRAPAAVVAEAQALLAEPVADGVPNGPGLVDWVETLLVYKLPRLSREEIRKMLNVLNVELKETRFYQEVFAEGQQEERLRIARSLLDVIADDRLLAEKTGLSEAEVRALRAQQH